MLRHAAALPCVLAFVAAFSANAAEPETLPDTKPLTMEGDIAAQLVDGVDRFLLRKLADSVDKRKRHFSGDPFSPEAYAASLEPNRKRLKHILGIRDERVPFDGLELISTTEQPALVGQGKNNRYKIYAVRWPAFGDVHGEGLLLVPDRRPVANIVAIPDADFTPEQLVGLAEGVPLGAQYARMLAEGGCRVVVPMLISRHREPRGLNGRRGANLTNREFLYRSAFELGRHLVGYEIQKSLAVVDWFKKDQPNVPIGVIGWGEGGLEALYAAAVDQRIDGAYVSGYFGSRQNLWQEPLDRNVFGLLDQFGDAELASMIAPRTLIVETARGPELELPSEGGGPGRLVSPLQQEVEAEIDRARKLIGNHAPAAALKLVPGGGRGEPAVPANLYAFLTALTGEEQIWPDDGNVENLRKSFDPAAREQRQMHEIDRHNQWLLAESEDVRKDFMKGLDTSSSSATR
jgi:hypothetical protein